MKRYPNCIACLIIVIATYSVINTFAQTTDLQTYVGQYQLNTSVVILITLDNGKLMMHTNGAPIKTELVAESETDFTVKGQPLKINFVKDANGKITSLVFIQSSDKITAPKVSSQTDTPVKPVDPSPHKSDFVTANGIKMNYLDWGGKGDVVLLLAGFGNDAHVFDDFAVKFTDKFRVIGLTRRGFGETDKPKAGYDTKTRVNDILEFLNALKIKKAHLIGHSLAGDEMTLFASLYPRRVKKLVYYDAAYDRAKLFSCEKDLLSFPRLYQRLLFEAMNCPNAKQIVVENMLPPDVWNIYVSTLGSSFTEPTDYSKVKAPAISFYDVSDQNPEITLQTDAETKKKMQDWWEQEMMPNAKKSREHFASGVKRGEVVEMKNAGHYLFQGKTATEVIRQTREFLLAPAKK